MPVTIVNGYCDESSIKAALGIPLADTNDDEALGRAINAASRAIDRWTSTQFYESASASSREFALAAGTTAYIPHATSVDSVQVDMTGRRSFSAVPSSAWAARRDTQAPSDSPFTMIEMISNRYTVETPILVSATWGWAETPPEIIEATIMQASRIFRRVREAPFGVASVSLDGGGLRLLSRLDPDVELLASPFRRITV